MTAEKAKRSECSELICAGAGAKRGVVGCVGLPFERLPVGRPRPVGFEATLHRRA